ncbi:ceramide-1-phosphate transfer protein [Nylanderia fulva]|uniref:ceramide-1-phosphate transfer protein n=1 Tax=Nylanderia fulva TaxID=613905 RepID=UPI0010FB1127|nr:ceramide-1-phosphate transfer protein [Nylanderia fulva]
MAEGPELSFLDLRIVHDYFDQALAENDDVVLRAYLDAYNELYKFFQLMGSVFSFVSSDLKQKIDILDNLLNTDNQQYTTVKSMIEYEKENKLLEKTDFVNGTRTLLRLNRGLDFIREFLRHMEDLSDDDKTGNCCRNAYNDTLGRYHPWVIRKAAVVAMYTLPTKEALFKKVCGENVQRNLDVLQKMLDVTAVVFYRIDSIYKTYEMHFLP